MKYSIKCRLFVTFVYQHILHLLRHTGSGVGASFWVSPKPSSIYVVPSVAPAWVLSVCENPNNNKIQNPQRSQRTRPKKSKTVSVLHVSRFTHTTRQQNQNPQKSLSRLDLLLSFHRNKPKVGSYLMPCYVLS